VQAAAERTQRLADQYEALQRERSSRENRAKEREEVNIDRWRLILWHKCSGIWVDSFVRLAKQAKSRLQEIEQANQTQPSSGEEADRNAQTPSGRNTCDHCDLSSDHQHGSDQRIPHTQGEIKHSRSNHAGNTSGGSLVSGFFNALKNATVNVTVRTWKSIESILG
jgi:hypothetical protein